MQLIEVCVVYADVGKQLNDPHFVLRDIPNLAVLSVGHKNVMQDIQFSVY